MPSRASSVQLVWFKRDLRVDDHEPLTRAAAAGPVLPVYVAEPDLWAEPDMSARHYAFIGEALKSLDRDLTRLGAPLILEMGDIVQVFERLHDATGFAAIWAHEETGNGWTFARDRRLAAWARARAIALHELPQGGVIRRLKTRNGWAARWEQHMRQPVLPPPPLQPASPAPHRTGLAPARDMGLGDDPCPERQSGDRADGLILLDSFLRARARPYRRAMSSPGPGAVHCSRLSPHLAYGTLSMRETAQALRARQQSLSSSPPDRRHPPDSSTRQWQGAMRSFEGRLHWRHHFMQKLEDAPSIEFSDLHPAYRGMRPAEPDAARLGAFEAGETGLPFVDACLRCLKATGWMNFRMRAMLQAFASYHLWLPWRASGLVLARLFTDYEPGIHWPQVQMQSGVTGINTIRIYNPVKQGFDQDPDGHFTRRWLPELAPVPDAFLQEPWRWSRAGSFLGTAYPAPIVDPVTAARAAKEKVFAVRRAAGFTAQANSIQNKHGSRKSGIKMTGQKANRPKTNHPETKAAKNPNNRRTGADDGSSDRPDENLEKKSDEKTQLSLF